MPELAPGTSRITLVLALAIVYVIWGSVYLGIRLVIDEVDPFQAMAQRFVMAGVILVAYLVLRGGWARLRVSRRQLVSMVVTGVLLLGLGNGLAALAQVKGLPSGITALVVASVPVWAVLLRAATGDRPSRVTVLGVFIGFVGLMVLVALGRGVGASMPVLAVVLVLTSSLSWTVGAYLSGRLALPDDVAVIAGYQQLTAAVCSTFLAVASGERFSMDYSARGWGAMAFLILGSSIAGFIAFAWLLTHVSLSLVATHAYVNPVVAVLLGWLVLSEPIGLPVVLGGGIVVAAVALIVSSERPVRPVPEPVAG